MTVASTAAKRWGAIAQEIGSTLPGQWSIQGRAMKVKVVREPIEWLFATIGANRRTNDIGDDIGWVFATVHPLIDPIRGLTLTYGLWMDEVAGAPKRIDFAAPDARDIALSFAAGPGLEVLQEYSLEKLATIAELDYTTSTDERLRKFHWLHAPAWRVILNTDSPEAPAQEALAWAKAKSLPDLEKYFTEFLAHWHAGGSTEVLSFLTKHRDRMLNILV